MLNFNLEQMISLLKNLKKGKFKVKRRQLSLHDSLKNLYNKHFARYMRSQPSGYQDYQEEEDPMTYY